MRTEQGPKMRLSYLLPALVLAVAMGPARADDLITVYRDAQVSDPVYQAQRAIFEATVERLPQARSQYLPLIAGTGSIFRNNIDRQIASDLDYTSQTYAITLSQPIFRLQNWIASAWMTW